MVSALTRIFGTDNLSLAEDVVQEALLQALKTWPFSGVPKNPAGWLYRVAKHKAIDVVRRQQSFARLAPGLGEAPASDRAAESLVTHLFLDEDIKDDTLQMMFTCCHPALPLESQVALTLKILCGFSSARSPVRFSPARPRFKSGSIAPGSASGKSRSPLKCLLGRSLRLGCKPSCPSCI